MASQSALGAELLSQAFESASTRPSLANPREELIVVETTDASKMVKDVSPILSLMLPKCFLKDS